MAMTQAERITALEVKVDELTKVMNSIEPKLDDLLALKNKGAGVFWIVSTLVGSGLIGFALTVYGWFSGTSHG